jgi:hypothetical protein
VPGADQSLQVDLAGVEQGLDDGRAELVQRKHIIVGQALPGGLKHRGGHGRSGGLEADADEDNRFLWILSGQCQGVEGGVNDAHVAAGGLGFLKARTASGHPQHVTKGSHDDIGQSVTQTGQPGPEVRVSVGGSSWRRPNFMMATVWPPQNSMRRASPVA